MKCLSVSSFDKILQVGNIDISDDESADPEQREIAERVLEEAWPQGYADWEGRLPLDVSSPWLTCHAEERQQWTWSSNQLSAFQKIVALHTAQ